MKNLTPFLCALSFVCVPLVAHAQGQNAHVHGLASLTLAIEGQVLEIQFESPAADIVGFEHKARSSEDKAALNAAKAKLEMPDSLFEFIGSSCSAVDIQVDLSGLLMEDGHHHKDHHSHKDHHDHQHAKQESHSEVTASYRYECSKASELSSIAVSHFEKFTSLQHIAAQWVTSSGQNAATLSPDQAWIQLK